PSRNGTATNRSGSWAGASESETISIPPVSRRSAGGCLTKGVGGYRIVPMLTTERPLDQLTKDELYDLAQAAGIDGRSKMDKGELVRALENRTDSKTEEAPAESSSNGD